MNPYESRTYLNEYLFFHYGNPRDFCPFPFAPKEALNFQQRVVRACVGPIRFRGATRGLDIGCAVGRSTFELARKLDEVLGIDNSTQFVRAAQRMARRRRASIQVTEEGNRRSTRFVRLPASLRRGRVSFRLADAQNLSRLRGAPFHVILAINLIDRLPRPAKFLAQLPDLVVPGGQLVLGSPFTWLEQYTPRREWIASARVPELLQPWFRVAQSCDLPFLIREHRRKYQWCVSEVTTYVRND